MALLKAVVLGLIQGITEFLPVSSSGHLVIFQALFKTELKGRLFFDVMVHIGTVVPLFIVFWQDIKGMVYAGGRFLFGIRRSGGLRGEETDYLRLLKLVLVASAPTFLLAWVFRRAAAATFQSPLLAASMLILTGIMLFSTRKTAPLRGLKEMKLSDALLIGAFQGLAIFPGISRSGMTICAGLLRGLKRPLAARFAFLVAIPAVCAAGLYEGLKAASAGASAPVNEALLGAGVAALSGYFALKAIIKIVRRGEISRFAYYLWIFGAAAIILQL